MSLIEWIMFRINDRTYFVSLLLLVGALIIYLGNGVTLPSGDAIGNSLLVFNWLDTGDFHFDRLQQATQGSPLSGWFAPMTGFRLSERGHWVSIYPIGSAIVTAPLYVLFYGYWQLTHWGTAFGAATGLPFEATRLFHEKLAAAIVAALSVHLFFRIACCRFTPGVALISAMIFGFASSTWTISAQGLWPHGSLNLMVMVMVWSLVQADKARSRRSQRIWLGLAGIACGLLPGVRQTGLLLAMVGGVYALARFQRWERMWLGLGLGLTWLPWCWWNQVNFGDALRGGYGIYQNLYAWSQFSVATPGIFVSPSRGLLVYMPIALFAIPGTGNLLHQLRQQRRDRELDWLLGGIWLASLGILLSYCFLSTWFAGYCYGSRFTTDILPGLSWVLAYYLTGLQTQLRRTKDWLMRPRIALVGFGLAGLVSLWMQVLGFVGHPIVDWNHSPWPANPWIVEANRFWDWEDTQWLRQLRSARHRHYQPLLTSPDYLGQFQAAVVGIAVHDGQPIAPPLATQPVWPYFLLDVLVQNQGQNYWYGYQSGIGVGEMYVQGELFNPQQQKVVTINFHLNGICQAGQTCRAYGLLPKLDQPGNYRLELQPGIVGIGTYNSRPSPRFQIPIVNQMPPP
jgi:hypothetical protein